MARVTENAWAAGIVDGEGCISVGRNNGLGGKYIGMHVIVRMADKEAVQKIARIAGVGSLKLHRPFTARRRPLWEWHSSSQEAASVLRRLLPYLVTKKIQARWFLKLAARMSQRRGPLTLKERRFQDEVVRMIRAEKKIR